jgi:hypothetical protein
LRVALPRRLVDVGRTALERVRRWRVRRGLHTAKHEFDRAYTEYWRSGVVPSTAADVVYRAMWASGGTYPTERVTQLAPLYRPERYATFADDLLSDLDPAEVAEHVRADGCYVSPVTLPTSVVDEIEAVLGGPAQPRGDGLGARLPDVPSPTAPTWWVAPERTLRAEAVRRLLVERRLVDTAGRYLGVDPMIMSVVLWKSYAWPSSDRNSAQLFHYDSDRAAFLKLFVYLTDVSAENGPHTYVVGSHREKPRALMHGDRLSDKAVERFFPRSSWKVITGVRGTVFFADTRGLHKGGRVTHGDRALFQINLGSDRFGIQQPPIGPAAEAPADLRAAVSDAPRFFAQLYDPGRLIP